MAEVKLMKGNEVIAEAAIRCGCDGYFGYPITPQSEVMETLMLRKPWHGGIAGRKRTGRDQYGIWRCILW
jgi:TPP-dependent indolepyruvate ferredoxin oxidoreductase alpha subunit